MSSLKSPMSTSYKAVFVISILMIFAVIMGGALSGSKSLGWGIWYWGYTAWKMYKRDNESLVVIHKVVLWFEAIAFSVALAVLLFSDAEVQRYVDFTPVGLIIIAALSMSVTYSLYRFFSNQKSGLLNSEPIVNSSTIDDIFWEQASRELDSVRHEATWAKAMASADGDDAKTKAFYIRTRAADLKRNQSSSNLMTPDSLLSKPDVVEEDTKNFLIPFGVFGKLVLIAIVAIIGFILYDLNRKSQVVSTDSAAPSTNASVVEKPIKNIDEVKNLCYVYWDGIKWQLGKTEGDKFVRFSRDFYGVEVLEFALPKQMVNELKISTKVGETVDNRRFEEFFNKYWYQVTSLCNFN